MDKLIKDAAKKYLMKILYLHKNVYGEFINKYPGICMDYSKNKELVDSIPERPTRNQAPCLTAKLMIRKSGLYKHMVNGFKWISTNIKKPHECRSLMVLANPDPKFQRDLIFYHKGKIENAFECMEIDYNESTMDLRKQYNQHSWTYKQLLDLWEIFYDEKLNFMIEIKYQKLLMPHLEKKFGGLNPETVNSDKLEIAIINEIKLHLHRNRYNVTYLRYFYG